jgi:hypothetical protein
MKKGEIQDICQTETDSIPGKQLYIVGYQKALATVVERLSPTEEAEFRDLAKEWTKKSPPVELQQK